MSLFKLVNSNPFPSLGSSLSSFIEDEYRWIKAVSKESIVPPVNIRENEDMYFLDIAIPGFSKDEILVSVDENVLNISSTKEASSHTEEVDCEVREYFYTSFSRSFTLPYDSLIVSIFAKYNNGVLTVTIEKSDEYEKGKLIDIK